MSGGFRFSPGERLYTPKETADRLKVSESFLAKKRLSGGGPKFIKVGRCVRYPETAINEYLRAQLRSSTSETEKSEDQEDEEPP
jgi:excisionase family DNA binding protein